MEKKVDVVERYQEELSNIEYTLTNLENGRYYEKSGARMDGYLTTNIQNIRKSLKDLIRKIEYNMDSKDEEMAKALFAVTDSEKNKSNDN